MPEAIRPLPIRDVWAPEYLKARGTQNRDFAFNLIDPEGAPAEDGRRYHAAVDWFAPGGTTIRAPRSGRVIDVERSLKTSGQVFGGTVRIQDAAGLVWVMRHVNPRVAIGQAVAAGQTVATVTKWRSGAPHLHLEIWRTATGGYRLANMIDPATFDWAPAGGAFYFEEMPDAAKQLERFQFGPWRISAARDRVMHQREQNTGRKMRPFSGKSNSLYPWED